MVSLKLPSNLERMGWDKEILHELIGKVVTADELKEQFKESEEYSCVELREERDKYKIYARNYKPSSDSEFPWPYKIAYECKSCKSIIIGPPKIKDNPLIHNNGSTIRKDGYEMCCGNCHSVLDYVETAHYHHN
ncbi:hypothetical protein HYT23_01930 [Candidatus Pacearchaeota archaeon]|nr:hypothetical protein [Candidatus Pacearchaeota archaeon]